MLWSAANISTWLWTGYNMLIMFSALQSIPQELHEAAKLDGASNWTIAWQIKVPIIAPSIIPHHGVLDRYRHAPALRRSRPCCSRSRRTISSTFTPNMLAYAVASGNNYQQAPRPFRWSSPSSSPSS
ncbi:carbohydrate ABC transporter permease [Streptomyces sp. L7]